jgi:hypothetical protein
MRLVLLVICSITEVLLMSCILWAIALNVPQTHCTRQAGLPPGVGTHVQELQGGVILCEVTLPVVQASAWHVTSCRRPLELRMCFFKVAKGARRCRTLGNARKDSETHTKVATFGCREKIVPYMDRRSITYPSPPLTWPYEIIIPHLIFFNSAPPLGPTWS